jgi:ATP-dependent helicase/DNAse subunit B
LYPWEVEINGKTCHFKLQGTIDRIDEIDAQIRIIDYKTGKTKRKASNVEDLFKREYFNRNNAVFQLLFYAMVFDHEKATDTYPGLYFTRELFKDVFDWHVEINRFPVESFYEYKTVYLEHLKILLDEIVNPEIAFSQTKDDKFCQTCPYNQICRR